MRMNIATAFTSALACTAILLPAVGDAATLSATNAQLARELRNESRDVRHRALYTLAKRDPATIEPEVRTAMIALLDDLNRIVADSDADGFAVATREDPEFIHSVATAVAQLEDSRAIPSLARARYGGRPVALQLARFGEQALPAVASVVEEPGAHYYQVEFGLITLMHLLQVQGEENLSAATMSRVRSIVRVRLTGQVYFTTLWWAIRVAAELRDPELTTILRRLANDPEESRQRGITEAHIIAKT
jgi:hypothetical protein